MQVWNVLHAACWKSACNKSPKIHHLGTIAQLCRVVSSQLRHVSTVGKNLLNSNIFFTCPRNMPNFDPLTAEWFHCLGHPSKFQRCVLASLLQRRCSPEANQTARCLAMSWAATVYIHFKGLLPRNRILPGAKFMLRPSLTFSYIGSITARHSSSEHQPNFAAWYKEWNYGTLAEGATRIRLGRHHVGHRPTF